MYVGMAFRIEMYSAEVNHSQFPETMAAVCGL